MGPFNLMSIIATIVTVLIIIGFAILVFVKNTKIKRVAIICLGIIGIGIGLTAILSAPSNFILEKIIGVLGIITGATGTFFASNKKVNIVIPAILVTTSIIISIIGFL